MKILLVANTDWYLFNFRLELASALREKGHEVVLCSPQGDYVERIRQLGFNWSEVNIGRKGVGLLREARSVLSLVGLYRRLQPTLVHHFTFRCVVYGALAARWCSVTSNVHAITGFGHLFSHSSMLRRALQTLVLSSLRVILHGHQVIVQNPDDQATLLDHGVIRNDNLHLIRGSGIDLARFPPHTSRHGPPMVLMACRLIREKGVLDFIEAARLVKRTRPEVRFVLAGAPDPGNPSSVTREELAEWNSDGAVELPGHCDDMMPLYASSTLFVLPSYYREGVPRALLEAAASELPLIATDMPGCREIVRNGVNGVLVPPHSPTRIAGAIVDLLAQPERRAAMAARSRQIAMSEFSKERVAAETLAVYRRALAYQAPHGQAVSRIL